MRKFILSKFLFLFIYQISTSKKWLIYCKKQNKILVIEEEVIARKNFIKCKIFYYEEGFMRSELITIYELRNVRYHKILCSSNQK